jgi:hypothetical protein
MSRSNLLRGIGIHTVVVVPSHYCGGVLQRRPASFSFSISLRVSWRLVPVVDRQWISSSNVACRGNLISRWNNRDLRHSCSDSSHSERLGDRFLSKCRLGFVIERLALAKPIRPLNLFICCRVAGGCNQWLG